MAVFRFVLLYVLYLAFQAEGGHSSCFPADLLGITTFLVSFTRLLAMIP